MQLPQYGGISQKGYFKAFINYDFSYTRFRARKTVLGAR